MKKYAFGLIFVLSGIGIVNLGFTIKVLIILSSLFLHVYTHLVVEKITISRFSKVNELINILSANIVNLAIGVFCLQFENEYFRYIAITNLGICLINLIPIYPFDGRGVVDIIIECIKLEERRNKLNKAVDKGTRVVLLAAGIIQLILYANNFSVLLLYMMVKVIKKNNVLI